MSDSVYSSALLLALLSGGVSAVAGGAAVLWAGARIPILARLQRVALSAVLLSWLAVVLSLAGLAGWRMAMTRD